MFRLSPHPCPRLINNCVTSEIAYSTMVRSCLGWYWYMSSTHKMAGVASLQSAMRRKNIACLLLRLRHQPGGNTAVAAAPVGREVVLCQAVLCQVVLCQAVLCQAVLCQAVLCQVVLWLLPSENKRVCWSYSSPSLLPASSLTPCLPGVQWTVRRV